jgi:hypothetical protein
MKTKKMYETPCVYGMEMFGGEAVMVSCSARTPKGYDKTASVSGNKAKMMASASPVKVNYTNFDW